MISIMQRILNITCNDYVWRVFNAFQNVIIISYFAEHFNWTGWTYLIARTDRGKAVKNTESGTGWPKAKITRFNDGLPVLHFYLCIDGEVDLFTP